MRIHLLSVVSIAGSSIIKHLWEESGFIFSAPSPGELQCPPKVFSSLSWTNQIFSLMLPHIFQPLTILVSLHWTLTDMWTSPLLGKPPLDSPDIVHLWILPFTGYCFPSARERGIMTFLPLLSRLLFIQVLGGCTPSLGGCTDMQQSALTNECQVMSVDNMSKCWTRRLQCIEK